jgi:hypothetical protein
VVVVAVGAYLLGASRQDLTILNSPRAETGVLWYCGDRLSGVARLPPGQATIVIGEREIGTVISADGLIVLELPDRPVTDRVRVERGELSVSVPVLDCAPSRDGE